jgi:hypothetical protein
MRSAKIVRFHLTVNSKVAISIMLYEPINLSMHFTFEKTQTLKVRDSGFILRFATVELSKHL